MTTPPPPPRCFFVAAKVPGAVVGTGDSKITGGAGEFVFHRRGSAVCVEVLFGDSTNDATIVFFVLVSKQDGAL